MGEVTDSAAETKKVFDVAIKTTKDNRVNTYCTGKLINGEDTKLEATQVPLFTALYLHSNVSYYKSCVKFLSEYIIADGKQDILKILQTFDKHIEDISIVGNDIYLFNSISGSLPLFSYGSGLQKALLLTSTIVNCKNGIILIDEIDNAIHVSAFKDVFKWFVDACIKNNVQAFITTHSMEAIDAILDIAHSNYSDEDLLRVITLRKSAIESIRAQGTEEAVVVNEANKYIDSLLSSEVVKARYFKHERLILKSRFSAVIAATNPTHSTGSFQDVVLSCPWESSAHIKEYFGTIIGAITSPIT